MQSYSAFALPHHALPHHRLADGKRALDLVEDDSCAACPRALSGRLAFPADYLAKHFGAAV